MIKYSKKDRELYTELQGKIPDGDYDALIRVFREAYKNANSKAEADNAILQFIHDQPYYDQNGFSDTKAGQSILKGLRDGSIVSTPAPLQATEKELGLPTDSDVMFKRLDEEALVKMFGAKDAEDMLNWQNPKHWSNLSFRDFNNMTKEAGLDPNAVMRSLAEMQENRDRSMVAEGYDPSTGKVSIPAWLGSAYMGVMAPRTKEAIKMGRDPSAKDYVLDIGANAVESIPIGRGIGVALKGVKPVARRVAVDALTASGAPIVENTADAILYDEDNPERARFNLGNTALGTAVNLATPYGVGAALNKYAKLTGNRGVGRKAMGLMQGDPYLDYLDRQQGSFNTVFDGQKLRNELDEAIMEDIIKDMEGKDLKKISAEQLEDYQAALNRKPNKRIKDARERKLTEILSGIERYNPEFAKRFEKIFNEENPSMLTPTAILEDNAFKYGLDESGNLAYSIPSVADEAADFGELGVEQAAKEAKTINSRHNLPQTITDRNAVDLVYDQLDEIRAAGGDRFYPVTVTEFDKKVQSFLDNPEFMTRVEARNPKKNLGSLAGLNFATNKLGKASYGYNLIAPDQVEALNEVSTGMSKKVKDILSDPTIIRQWDAGFKPDPKDVAMSAAYEWYKKWKEEQPEKENIDYSSASASKSSSMSLPEVKVKAGKKAGF